jgi:hypothetical protein
VLRESVVIFCHERLAVKMAGTYEGVCLRAFVNPKNNAEAVAAYVDGDMVVGVSGGQGIIYELLGDIAENEEDDDDPYITDEACILSSDNVFELNWPYETCAAVASVMHSGKLFVLLRVTSKSPSTCPYYAVRVLGVDNETVLNLHTEEVPTAMAVADGVVFVGTSTGRVFTSTSSCQCASGSVQALAVGPSGDVFVAISDTVFILKRAEFQADGCGSVLLGDVFITSMDFTAAGNLLAVVFNRRHTYVHEYVLTNTPDQVSATLVHAFEVLDEGGVSVTGSYSCFSGEEHLIVAAKNCTQIFLFT